MASDKRAPRPVYSEQEKYFIVYKRIVGREAWNKIADQYARIFSARRSISGLTAVYYRIRTEWSVSLPTFDSNKANILIRWNCRGLPAVTDCDSDACVVAHWLIHARALNFSEDFLNDIGYDCPSEEGDW